MEELTTAPSALPELWAFGAGRLAIGSGDAGAIFDVTAQALTPIGEFELAAGVRALAFTTRGALMTASDGVADFACFVDGGCARDPYSPNAAPRLEAASEQGVSVVVQHTLLGTGDPSLFAPNSNGTFTFSYLSSTVGQRLTVGPGDQVPRRPHEATLWGMSVVGVVGMMNLANAERWSSTDTVVWASSNTVTAVWCEPR